MRNRYLLSIHSPELSVPAPFGVLVCTDEAIGSAFVIVPIDRRRNVHQAFELSKRIDIDHRLAATEPHIITLQWRGWNPAKFPPLSVHPQPRTSSRWNREGEASP